MSIGRAVASVGSAALLAALLTAHPVASATTPDSWKSTQYLIPAGDTTIEQVFADFRRLMSVSTDLSEGVRGPTAFSGQAMTVETMLDSMAARHGLSWFVFRNRLYVSLASESREMRLRVAAARMPEVRNYLLGIKLLDDRFTWIEMASRDEVMVQGPPAYLALMRENAESVRPADVGPVGPPPEPAVIMTFRLKHALAADDPSGRPGVASMLSKLFDARSGGFTGLPLQLGAFYNLARQTNATADRTANASRVGTTNGGAAAVQRELARNPSSTGEDNDDLRSASSPTVARRGESRADAPSIEAEPRLNMVIVRDKASRRAEYERVIAMLDVVTEQIALDATVIELPADALRAALSTLSAAAASALSPSGAPALIVPRHIVERAFEQVSRARRQDGSATILTQGIVFSEDDPFSLDFADSKVMPQYSTTIWQQLAASLVPIKISASDGERRVGIRMSGSAKYTGARTVALKLDLAEDRSTPELRTKSSVGRTTSANMSVELREDQVLVLSNSSVWSGEDMREPRGRAVLLSAQRWQARSVPLPPPGAQSAQTAIPAPTQAASTATRLPFTEQADLIPVPTEPASGERPN